MVHMGCQYEHSKSRVQTLKLSDMQVDTINYGSYLETIDSDIDDCVHEGLDL